MLRPTFAATLLRTTARTVAGLALLAGLPAAAQNPIASKVVGSEEAARHRLVGAATSGWKESAKTDAALKSMRLPVPTMSIIASSVRPFLDESPSPEAQRARAAAARLDSLRSKTLLAPLVDEAIAFEKRADTLTVQGMERAIARVTNAYLNGHTNPERWYVGGQVGLKLFGDGELGSTMRASARGTYFVPISALRRWQLPVVTNLSPTKSDDDKAKAALQKTLTTSEGAFLSAEPTLDPIYPTPYRDIRVQPFAAIGGQFNTLKDRTDSSDVPFGQLRAAVGTNVEIGVRGNGKSVLFLSTRLVRSQFGASAHQRAFGERRRSRTLLETYVLVPIPGSMAVLGEFTAAQGAGPVIRFGFWSQAVASKSEETKAENGSK
jgi:hypothetical protein